VNEKHTVHTVEVRYDDGIFMIQLDLYPKVYHHPTKDLCVLHLGKVMIVMIVIAIVMVIVKIVILIMMMITIMTMIVKILIVIIMLMLIVNILYNQSIDLSNIHIIAHEERNMKMLRSLEVEENNELLNHDKLQYVLNSGKVIIILMNCDDDDDDDDGDDIFFIYA